MRADKFPAPVGRRPLPQAKTKLVLQRVEPLPEFLRAESFQSGAKDEAGVRGVEVGERNKRCFRASQLELGAVFKKKRVQLALPSSCLSRI